MSLGLTERELATTRETRPSVRRLALGYLELTKPRIMTLVMITGVPALLMAAGTFPPARLFWGTLAGISLAAASAASFNMFLDRDIDGLMRRTAGRPLPSGLLPPAHALGLAFLLAACSWVVLVTVANLLSAVIAMVSIFYYAVIYTAWLKRRTPQNIVIGGAAGASAPLIAWAAVTGSIALPAVLMFAIVFLWTPPHFWALALYRSDDYARAGIPMLPVTHGEVETRRQIIAYAVVLVPVTLALAMTGHVGPIFGVPAGLMGTLFLVRAIKLWRANESSSAPALFLFSILYLFTLFVALTLDTVVGIALAGLR